jgi:DNA topoisomerase-1
LATKNLVIVESAAKAKTLEKFLGRDYVVRASLGHVRDLPKSRLGVDVERDFQPQYLVPKEKREVVNRLKQQARSADAVYLATDPDREGEAIAWHLVETLDLKDKPVHRIEFHEVTKNAVLRALAERRGIDFRRVDAQQARRVLDRLVGYKISPLLWRKVKRGLSAGRVQSVAVRMIVDRERAIERFVPVEYWSLEAELAKRATGRRAAKPQSFRAALLERAGAKIELPNEETAQRIVADLEGATWIVANVRQREQQRHPAAPFTTSTLQQEAYRKLRFTAKRTMAVAQALYEGVDIGGGESVGLITYMRTDSTNVAQEAVQECRALVRQKYGPSLLPETPRVYTKRSKLAQEAHEAIRPTSVWREPEQLRPYLTPEQYKLYDLVWKRFVASQMASAVYEITTVDVHAAPRSGGEPYLFRASGSKRRFDGFLAIYLEGRDDDEAPEEERKPLPELAPGEPLDLLQLVPEQHFTQPPPRYTEATLVKALEERGIGRPSTYAPILSTIQERGYVEKVDQKFRPTELGILVNDLLVQHFGEIVDLDFTAALEDKLDDIAQGERPWVPVVREFYEPFEQDVQRADAEIPKQAVPAEPSGEHCEKCGRELVIKLGRFGRFLACPGFPECRNAKPLLARTGVACPRPGCGGELVERRSKRGRVFYGCVNWRADGSGCDWVSWNRPVPEPCPTCGGLQVQVGRDRLRCLTCEPEPATATVAANGRRAGSARGRSSGSAARPAAGNGRAGRSSARPTPARRRAG